MSPRTLNHAWCRVRFCRAKPATSLRCDDSLVSQQSPGTRAGKKPGSAGTSLPGLREQCTKVFAGPCLVRRNCTRAASSAKENGRCARGGWLAMVPIRDVPVGNRRPVPARALRALRASPLPIGHAFVCLNTGSSTKCFVPGEALASCMCFSASPHERPSTRGCNTSRTC